MPFLTLKSDCLFKTSISDKEVGDISRAKSKEDIITLWDKIRDWFCGTSRVEAKKLLFILMSEAPSSEVKLDAFLKLYGLCTDTYKNSFNIHTQSYLDMEYLDDDSNQGKMSVLVLSIKGENLEISTKVSLEEIKDKNADNSKIPSYIERKFTVEGGLQVNSLLLNDISRCNYNVTHKGESFCWRVGDNITNKEQTINNLLSNSNEHQQKWCNILCSQLLVTAAMDYTNQHHPEAEFVSVGSDFDYYCNIDFIGESILVKVCFHNKNDKNKILTLYGRLNDIYGEVCIKAAFLITKEELITLNRQCFGDGDELVLND